MYETTDLMSDNLELIIMFIILLIIIFISLIRIPSMIIIRLREEKKKNEKYNKIKSEVFEPIIIRMKVIIMLIKEKNIIIDWKSIMDDIEKNHQKQDFKLKNQSHTTAYKKFLEKIPFINPNMDYDINEKRLEDFKKEFEEYSNMFYEFKNECKKLNSNASNEIRNIEKEIMNFLKDNPLIEKSEIIIGDYIESHIKKVEIKPEFQSLFDKMNKNEVISKHLGIFSSLIENSLNDLEYKAKVIITEFEYVHKRIDF